ncbi:MAG TPA: nucleotidyltransferase domain-containing protein [Ktedonobacterales bacterium]
MTSSTTPYLGQQERALLLSILRAHGVRHASLFGSYARGEQSEASDIDLVVDLPPGKSLFDVSMLGLALEDALGRRVDIVTSLDRLHPLMRERVVREQEVLL